MVGNEASRMLESQRAKGEMLAERWEKFPGKSINGFQDRGAINFLEGITDMHQRAVLAQLFENAFHTMGQMDEATRTLQVGSYEKFVFPMIRAVMANLVASELVTVHPLDAPTGLIFSKAA